MGGLFGIGTYQSISGGTVYAGGFPTSAFQLGNPYAGTYGGQFGYVLDTRIRAPKQVQYLPAGEIGMDSVGTPVVRGYPQMLWTYSALRPDYWYYLINTYNQSGRTVPGFQYLVLLQYPDTSGNNNPVQVLARWDPPTHGARTVGAYLSIQLKFTYLGQLTLVPGTPIITLT